MNLHIKTPFAIDKDLGKAYNEAMRDIPNGDWCCMIDYDVCFLTHETIPDIYEYIRQNPGAGLLTCLTNRIGSDQQIHWEGNPSVDMRWQTKSALNLRSDLYKTKRLEKSISGFLMCVSKEVWNEYKFPEGGKCLGVDNKYSASLLEAGKDVLLMQGVYVWHSYRLLNGSKQHLE